MKLNRLEDQELAMLSLHLLQICLVYINTLMIQQILSEPEWANSLTAEDLRALTPVLRQNLVTIDIVDFLQSSATLYGYEGISILAVLLFQSLTQRAMQFGS
jgi:hypothetical protein